MQMIAPTQRLKAIVCYVVPPDEDGQAVGVVFTFDVLAIVANQDDSPRPFDYLLLSDEHARHHPSLLSRELSETRKYLKGNLCGAHQVFGRVESQIVNCTWPPEDDQARLADLICLRWSMMLYRIEAASGVAVNRNTFCADLNEHTEAEWKSITDAVNSARASCRQRAEQAPQSDS